MSELKFRFKVQEYQTAAALAVVDVFHGQGKSDPFKYSYDWGSIPEERERARESWAAAKGPQVELIPEEQPELLDEELSEYGYANEDVHLSGEALLKNIHAVQSRYGIRHSERLCDTRDGSACALDIEMETGTGKTYVYIETMFELYKAYGWSKFIIVVPSVAIREGVLKSFAMMSDHFLERYGHRARYFVYDSENLSQLDNFATDSGLNVMVINMQAFNRSLKEGGTSKAALRIYGKRDEFGSRRPIDVIAGVRPIVIEDEPQKMGGPATKAGIKRFRPLFRLHYSATHAEHHDLLYVLDAVDAYNQHLVKRIEVKGFHLANLTGTGGFVYLDEIKTDKKKPPCAQLVIEVSHKGGTKRERHGFYEGDDLYPASGRMTQYREGFKIARINAGDSAPTVEFTGGLVLHLQTGVGALEGEALRRVQIRETIKSHLARERELFPQGIKVLSLFFIDKVEKYRKYQDGEAVLGEYGKIFEEEYRALTAERELFSPEYAAYLDGIDAHETHQGYFSIDKKGHMIDSEVKRGQDESDDVSAYDLILKDKERLLSFEEPTRFIFSHSALREGWDNPNVFQICTLKQADSQTAKRQEVGRGLRLAVDRLGVRQDEAALGERVHDINCLTVIASESYEQFVGDLQKDMSASFNSAYRQREATANFFAGRLIKIAGEDVELSEKQGGIIYKYLVKNDYVDDDDHLTDKYREAKEAGTLAPLPETLTELVKPELLKDPAQAALEMRSGVLKLIASVIDDSVFDEMISDASKTAPENLFAANENFKKAEFQALWEKINHRYAYRVDFESAELVKKAARHLDEELHVGALSYTLGVGGQQRELSADLLRSGESFKAERTSTQRLAHAGGRVKYDLVGELSGRTQLTRRTVTGILKAITSATFLQYRENPEAFIREAAKIINAQKGAMVVEHIAYRKLEGSYDASIFTAGASVRDLSKAFDSRKHQHKAVQDCFFVDGTAEESVERKFAKSLELNDKVKVYAKLPTGFKIPTPVGGYTPDWAIVFEEGSVRHIYFIAETKGTMDSLGLRGVEKAKIACTKRLFAALFKGEVSYEQVDSFDALMTIVK